MSTTTPDKALAGRTRPRLSQLAIWNMCVGFFGIQIGFALQNGNASRIFQTLGAEVDNLLGKSTTAVEPPVGVAPSALPQTAAALL